MVGDIKVCGGMFSCKKCSYTNKVLKNVTTHVKTHVKTHVHVETHVKTDRKVRVANTNEMSHPHKCIICSFRSTKVEYLKNHAYTHKNLTYKCTHTGCTFIHTNFVIFQNHRSKFSHTASEIERVQDSDDSDDSDSSDSDDSDSSSV